MTRKAKVQVFQGPGQYVEIPENPDASYDAAGTASSTMAAHVATSDPHPQYATDTDLANHVAAADPHPQYTTAAELAAAIAGVDIAATTHAATSKSPPVDADEFPIADSAASYGLKKLTWVNLKAAMWAAWGALIAGGTAKATPVNADSFAICDSAASNATKTLTFTALKAFLKTYFDTLYTGGPGTPPADEEAEDSTVRSIASGTNFPFDNTIPQITEGVAQSHFDVTITPTSATSRIELELSIAWLTAAGATQVTVGFFQDAIANALYASDVQVNSGGENDPKSFRKRVASGSTAARTYRVRMGSSAATAYYNQGNGTRYFGGVESSLFTAKEIL